MTRATARGAALARRPTCVTVSCVLAALASLQAGQTTAQAAGPEPQPLYEVSLEDLPDLHRGSLEKWRQLFAAPTFTEADMSFRPRGPGDQPQGSAAPPDLSVEGYLAWSAATGRIYCAIEVTDDVYCSEWTDQATLPRRTDHAWIGVDGDASGGQFRFTGGVWDCELSPEQAWELGHLKCYETLFFHLVQAQVFYWINAGPTGGLLTMFGHRPWLFEHRLVDAAGAVHSDHSLARYSLVASITPFDDLDWRGLQHSAASVLTPNRVVGVAVWIEDADGEQDLPDRLPDIYTTHVPPVDSYGSSDQFPRYRLLGLDEAPSAARRASWSQVKASVQAADE